MPDFQNFSGYFEIMAGLLGLFTGSKGFREAVYQQMIDKRKAKFAENRKQEIANLSSSIHEKFRSLLTSKFGDQINDQGSALEMKISDKSVEFENRLQNIENKYLSATTKSLEHLANLKFSMKSSFILSFGFCVYVLLYNGISELPGLSQWAWHGLMFFSNVLIMNCMAFVLGMTRLNKGLHVVDYVFYLFVLFGLNLLLSQYVSYPIQDTSVIVIAVIIPVSPFVLQLTTEMLSIFGYLVVFRWRLQALIEESKQFYKELENWLDYSV